MARKCPICGKDYPNNAFFCGNDGAITVEVQPQGEADPRLGTQLGGYVVAARIADGAMGRVYEGRHPETKARVAVKVLHADVAQDDVAVERFKREFETADELDHPNIVRVIEFGETGDGSWFMAMEYLDGEELSVLLERQRDVAFERAVRILCQLCLGIDEAHSSGVIHRDLKPDNVFLCATEAGDEVRVLDLGSVKLQMETGPKLTAFGTTLGSPYYMSPEQAMGKQDLDQRTDVFAVTAILYEMLTGKVAFEGDTIADILMKILQGTPAPPSTVSSRVPSSLDAVFERGLSKDKQQRFGSVRELCEAFLSGLGLSGSIEQWAQATVGDIRQQLKVISPKSLRPPAPPRPAKGGVAGRKNVSQAMRAPAARTSSDENSDSEYSLPTRSGPGKWVLWAVCGVAVVTLVAFLALK